MLPVLCVLYVLYVLYVLWMLRMVRANQNTPPENWAALRRTYFFVSVTCPFVSIIPTWTVHTSGRWREPCPPIRYVKPQWHLSSILNYLSVTNRPFSAITCANFPLIMAVTVVWSSVSLPDSYTSAGDPIWLSAFWARLMPDPYDWITAANSPHSSHSNANIHPSSLPVYSFNLWKCFAAEKGILRSLQSILSWVILPVADRMDILYKNGDHSILSPVATESNMMEVNRLKTDLATYRPELCQIFVGFRNGSWVVDR